MYWAWWMGGAALAFVAIGFLLATGRGLGVSGAFSALIDTDAWRADKKRRALQLAEPDDVQAALEAATLAEFGELTGEVAPASVPIVVAPKLGAVANFLLISGLVLGGAIAAWQMGAWGQATMGASFTALFGKGPASFLILLGGGFLVGAGTKLAGGCTSGHGLVGSARLQWPSVISTALFFGTAIVVSLLMEKFL